MEFLYPLRCAASPRGVPLHRLPSGGPVADTAPMPQRPQMSLKSQYLHEA